MPLLSQYWSVHYPVYSLSAFSGYQNILCPGQCIYLPHRMCFLCRWMYAAICMGIHLCPSVHRFPSHWNTWQTITDMSSPMQDQICSLHSPGSHRYQPDILPSPVSAGMSLPDCSFSHWTCIRLSCQSHIPGHTIRHRLYIPYMGRSPLYMHKRFALIPVYCLHR